MVPLSRIGSKSRSTVIFRFTRAWFTCPGMRSRPGRNRGGDLSGSSITYRDFGRATNGLAALLGSLGLEPGPIVIMMPNSIEMDVALMAVMSVGAQVAPVNPFFTVAEVCKVLRRLRPPRPSSAIRARGKRRMPWPGKWARHVVTVGEAASPCRNGPVMPASTAPGEDAARRRPSFVDFHRRHYRAFQKASTTRIAG